jgi:hypothetical protein
VWEKLKRVGASSEILNKVKGKERKGEDPTHTSPWPYREETDEDKMMRSDRK